MPDNLDTEKKSHSHLLRTKKLKFTLTNFCSSLGETETNKQIDAAFSVWQSVCGLSFQKVKLSEDKGNCEIKISFLTDHDAPNTVLTHKTNCPYKLNGQKGRTSAHAFYSGKNAISEDIPFDSETWKHQKTVPGDRKYNLCSAASHELGYALGVYHFNEKDSVMTPFYKHGFSTENMHEIPGESNKALIQQMYGKPTEGKSVEMKAVFNSTKAKAIIRKNVKNSQPEKV